MCDVGQSVSVEKESVDSEDSSSAKKLFVAGMYMTCSSLMLMVNKLSITVLPKPAVVIFVQFAFAALATQILNATEIVEEKRTTSLRHTMLTLVPQADALETGKVRAFVPVVFAQVAVIFTGMKAGPRRMHCKDVSL